MSVVLLYSSGKPCKAEVNVEVSKSTKSVSVTSQLLGSAFAAPRFRNVQTRTSRSHQDALAPAKHSPPWSSSPASRGLLSSIHRNVVRTEVYKNMQHPEQVSKANLPSSIAGILCAYSLTCWKILMQARKILDLALIV